MSRLATAFVLGYHGCAESVAKKAIAGKIDLLHSDEKHDWLGPGAYFWESDPHRALEWAQNKVDRGELSRAAVVGAVIDLRLCLDLTNRKDIEIVKAAARSFMRTRKAAGLPMPKNVSAARQADPDRSLRYLDCAVFRHLHRVIERNPKFKPFDTVRGIFTEGGSAFRGSGFKLRTHTQIAVRTNECILGLFWPRPYPSLG